MVERKKGPAGAPATHAETGAEAAAADTGPEIIVPAPPAQININTVTWGTDQVMHRIHEDKYEADAFNPGKGWARFSPIKDGDGKQIPTLYAGTTFECAVMETVFHNVPFEPGLKPVPKKDAVNRVHSQLTSKSPLKLADLTSIGLRKIGVKKLHLIETDGDQYSATQGWAEAIYVQHADVQGLFWTSRQNDQAQAIMLFGDRVIPGTLQVVAESKSLINDEATWNKVLDLAEDIDAYIVPDNAEGSSEKT